MDEFKEILKMWITIDDEILNSKNRIKELKKKKVDITPKILEFMKDNNLENLNLNNKDKLKYHITSSKKSLSKKYILDNLSVYFNDSMTGEKITNQLLDNRPVVEKIQLKRIISNK